MSDGMVHLAYSGGVATLTFDRVAARNAMTWSMYSQLVDHCSAIREHAAVRVVVLRGAGGKAFVAGTDIAQFATFANGEEGVSYERRIDACIGAIESLPMPTVAVVEGWAAGGGLLIASACDFRIASEDARFAAPIAATVGNTLSIASVARLLHAWGAQAAKRMLLLAEPVCAKEALQIGFLHRACATAELDAELDLLVQRLATLAPLTQSAAKEAVRRLVVDGLPDGEDLVRGVYGSRDFKEGVRAFMERRTPVWMGS